MQQNHIRLAAVFTLAVLGEGTTSATTQESGKNTARDMTRD
jgi:hypothetical protein